MANNRLYIRCRSCGKYIHIGSHMGHCYWTPSPDFQDKLDDFYQEHAFCQFDKDPKGADGFSDRGDFEIAYEIAPNDDKEREI